MCVCVWGGGITIVSGPGGGSFEPPTPPPPLATGLYGIGLIAFCGENCRPRSMHRPI